MALTILVDKVINSIDKGKYCMGLFLDASKAFDTVDHTILLDKLDKYGIRGVCKNWITSYLSNRSKYVSFNSRNFTSSKIICGVPQGSIMAPLRFILYVNDIGNVSYVLFPILFADDTNVFIGGHNLWDMCDIMNSEMGILIIWLNVNELFLNVEKTHYMIFKSIHTN